MKAGDIVWVAGRYTDQPCAYRGTVVEHAGRLSVEYRQGEQLCSTDLASMEPMLHDTEQAALEAWHDPDAVKARKNEAARLARQGGPKWPTWTGD